MQSPLKVPADFDPVAGMLRHETEYGVFHETRKSCRLACELIANGTPADLALATTVLEAVLQCQMTDPADAHQGNFCWMAEDNYIEDLNAVVFCLENLIPMMLRHRQRLEPDLTDQVLQAVELGLQEIQRLNVWVGYTNITVLALLALCLGGDLLGNKDLERQGQEKLKTWIAFTANNGHVLEFNSPTYAAVTIRALAKLRDTVTNPDTALLAEIMLCRLGLSYALHLHRGSGRLSGPHARAYQPSMAGDATPERLQFQQWITEGILPAWLTRFHAQLPDTYTVREGILHALASDMTTHVTPDFALGSTSRSFHPQGNHVIAHYGHPAGEGTGVFYTRYILDDKWLGDFYHATDRSNSRNLLDEGEFLGVQQQGALLGCYAPRSSHTLFRSAKTSFIWAQPTRVRQVRVNDREVSQFPYESHPDVFITIVTASVVFILRSLYVSSLLAPPVLVLDQREGDLVCEIYHYRASQPKRFWDLAWPGAFYKGRPACLFYLELVDRNTVGTPKDLNAYLAQIQLDYQIDPALTRTQPADTRLLRATVQSPAGSFALNVDLMDFAPVPLDSALEQPGTVLLESSSAVQRQESFDLQGTHVSFTQGNVTFCPNRKTGEWHLIQMHPEPSQVEVATEHEVHSFETPGLALVQGQNQQVSVRALSGDTE